MTIDINYRNQGSGVLVAKTLGIALEGWSTVVSEATEESDEKTLL